MKLLSHGSLVLELNPQETLKKKFFRKNNFLSQIDLEKKNNFFFYSAGR